MKNALIVSCSEKGTAFITQMLGEIPTIREIVTLEACNEARRMLLKRDFDLVIVNAPLRAETGESFSRDVASKSVSQIILIVNADIFDAVADACEGDGVLMVSKPVNKAVFWSSLKLAGAAHNRLKRMQTENINLRQKIEDVRIIDRAKLLIISILNMSEKEAHRYIEKQAMDLRISRREVAEGILRTYEQ
ncbi:MAG: ANTAR domain-containing protein [Defluviitaleaceae bacterium]|nr:ANTAR domain-containing protein [Defluviitaleaceae bacterium]